MVGRSPRRHSGDMSETSQQPQPPPQSGLNTQHLRDYRSLRRSTTDRRLAGVAGGLGRHLNIDPLVLRVLFVVLVFVGGAGVLLYAALWLLVPEDNGQRPVVANSEGARNTLLAVVGAVAVLLILSDTLDGFGFPWGLTILALIAFVVLARRDSRSQTPVAGPPTPTGTGYPTAEGAPAAAFADVAGYPGYPSPPAYVGGGDAGDPPGYPPYGGPSPDWQPPPAPRRNRGPLLFGITLAVLALSLGALGVYESLGGTVIDAAYPALALAVIGTMLLVGSIFGRPGGLILLGIIAALALAATAVGGPRFDGDRSLYLAPVSASGLQDSYHVPAGHIELDLRGVRDLEALDGRSIDLSANAGEIVVILPEDLTAVIDAQVAFGGAIELPGRVSHEGWSIERQLTVAGSDPAAMVDIELDVQFGNIEVRQP